MPPRSAGLLLHLTSLPSRFGIGDLGPTAEAMLDWMLSAGLSIWQVMPLGPTGYGNSPYGCRSAFAGNPLLISPEMLASDGLLPAGALDSVPAFPLERVDFERVRQWKETLFRLSFETARRERPSLRDELTAFAEAPEQREWLDDWTFFAALSTRFPDAGWANWPREIVERDSAALAAARRELSDEIAFQTYLQWLFFGQWNHLHAGARRRDIAVMGDIPIYVAFDSADVWARRHFFTVDTDGHQETVAGVPPDYFSATGQLWGNPLYRWDALAEDGYHWWVERMRMNFRLADLVRIDHFRGFAAYWEVKAGETTAINGRWVPGPGLALFSAIRSALGDLPTVAEDLGTIDDDVRTLLRETGYPGMKVLQFAFSEPDHPYLPHRHVPDSVVYTGTHDNDTTRGWFLGLGHEERARALDYVGGDGHDIAWDLIRAAFTSVADRAIVPLQDVARLGSEAWMNTPGRAGGNWEWRAREFHFSQEAAAGLRRLAVLTGRAPAAWARPGS